MKPAYLDTNVLVYAANENEPEKCQKARELLVTECSISLIGVNEFCSVLVRKYNKDFSEVRRFVDRLIDTQTVLTLSIECIHIALAIQERYGYRYFDSLHLAIALHHEADVFLSEDLQDGAVITWALAGCKYRIRFAQAEIRRANLRASLPVRPAGPAVGLRGAHVVGVIVNEEGAGRVKAAQLAGGAVDGGVRLAQAQAIKAMA